MAAGVFVDAILQAPVESGLSTFGRPRELAILWSVAGLAVVSLLMRSPSRAALARRLTLTLLACCLFGQRAVPAQPGALLVLSGVALLVARPLLVATTSAWVGLAALALAIPAAVASPFTLGIVLWVAAAVPWCSLAVLLPSLFAGTRARRAAIVFVGTTSLLALAGLATYAQLAGGLDLPLEALLATRLRPLGLHPNLAVPQLVAALVVGCGLVWRPGTRRRVPLAIGLLPIVGALAAVQSRTGHLTAVAGLAILIGGRLPWRPVRWLRPAVAVALVLALLYPASGLSDRSITHQSASMVSKAVSFRSAMWELGRDTASQAPWHGFGPGRQHVQARYALPSRYDGLPKNDHPHNVLIAVRSMLGWPGVLALALLLAAALRRRFGGPLLADAATAAVCAMWGANALDMGGAAQTHYPALAFVLLGLADAAARAPSTAGTLPLRVGTATLAVLALPLGAASWISGMALGEASRELQSDPLPQGRVADLIVKARTFAPWDGRVLELEARLAERLGNQPAQIAATERALELRPDSARLAHTLALLEARRNPDAPRVAELLDRAVELDAHGLDAWRRHVDRALLAAHRDDEDTALTSLVTALLMAPHAVERLTWNPAAARLTLSVDGKHALTFPLDQVLAEVSRRRDDLGEGDPATALRLRMREVEILQTLGEHERAIARAERVLEGKSFYPSLQLGRSALAEGRFDDAIELLTESFRIHRAFRILTDLIEAHSHASEVDLARFDALVDEALVILPDVTFEPDALVRLLEARRRVAERQSDPVSASRWAQASQFAQR